MSISTYQPAHKQSKAPTYQGPEARGNSTERGYGTERWKRYSEWFRMANPLCASCGGPAQHVDHVQPVSGGEDDPLFWEARNHQSLCERCHGRKTRMEN